MRENNNKDLHKVIQIDEGKIKDHLGNLVKKSVEELKSDFQIVRYCFNSDQRSGYPEM